MLNYASKIFQDSGSDLDSNMSAFILISVQIMATLIATSLIDKLGRRKLYFASTTGTAVGSALMGTFTYLSAQGYDLQNWNWAPVASLSFSLFSSSFGIFPLTFVVLAEVLPPKVTFPDRIKTYHLFNRIHFSQIRPTVTSLCTALISVFLFVIVSVFPLVISAIELYGVFWIFMTVCLLGVVFTVFVLPETTGKNIN